MIYFTNTKDQNIDNIRQLSPAFSSSNTDSTLLQYHMEAPFKLEFYTFHPDDPEQYFAMTSLSPNEFIYSALTKEEIKGQLEKARLHQHGYYEFLFVLSGEVYQIIENKRHLYTTGSCCLLNKNIFHTEEHSTDFRIVFLDISDTFMESLFADFSLCYFEVEKQHNTTGFEGFLSNIFNRNDTSEKGYIDFIPKQNEQWLISHIHFIFEELTKELLNPKLGSSSIIKGQILRLFSLLNQPENFENTPVQIGSDKENALFHSLENIMITTNGKISRTALEKELHYSGDHINKICKKYTGMSLYSYGMSFCMQKAASLLLETSLTIEEIALSLGFNNRTNFYKQFQAIYNQSPAAYRKTIYRFQHRQEPKR